MELIGNSVWILKYYSLDYNRDEQLVVFSSKEHAEDYKKSVIDNWIKSITRDSIPKRLGSRAEIVENAKNYPETIRVDKDHYSLVKGMKCEPNLKPIEYWYYTLMSNKEWDEYYKSVESNLVIDNYTIC